ncbi:nuclear transport factor 2 family protein [Chitinophaga sedimenti]|uniref:nuclear transport factor 2 family protein n=1 Tax=Chitinophaga sedimenti TaxID=2033606 RepID=UPI0020068BEF|nr:nuclear transport factor 2 family protein [Chitinophaga sedimenti]MCK7554226.1 nuclear transport factor 2 family protein [Chitinophaga sedimenti]
MIKRFVPALCCAALLAACGNQAVKNDNERLARQYFEHFNNHDWEKMAAMYTDTVELKDPSLGTSVVLQTHEQVIAKYRGLHNMLPNIHDSILQVYPSGEKHVIVEFISTGAADSFKIALPIVTIFEFKDGKISKDYTYYDNAGSAE